MASLFGAWTASRLNWTLQRGYAAILELEFLDGNDPLDVSAVDFVAGIVTPDIGLSIEPGDASNKIEVGITAAQCRRLVGQEYQWALDDAGNGTAVLAGDVSILARGTPGPTRTTETIQIVHETIVINVALVDPSGGGASDIDDIDGGDATTFGAP